MKILTAKGYRDVGISDRDALIKQCARIADPWPESDGKSEVDEVRRKIAASIRSLLT